MWYIDSWAVFDGLAFASERRPNSLDASTTVFLSVPDLEPVPIGRISTALRAQRAGFQDGFRDDDGEELGLETLDQVRELVRRAYLGGSLGSTPQPEGGRRPVHPLLAEPDAESFTWDGPPGGVHYENALKHLAPDPQLPVDYSVLQFHDDREKMLLSLHASGRALLLYPYLRAFGEATILELACTYRTRLHLPEYRDLFAQWTGLLWALGLWDSHQEFGGLFVAHGLSVFGLDPASDVTARKDLLFRIPAPLRKGWDRRIQTLAHKLFLTLVNRSYFQHNDELPEFIPSLFCSLVMVSTPLVRASGIPRLQRTDRLRLLGRAFFWLLRELPRVELPPKVEYYLAQFADDQLSTNPARSQ